MNVINIAATEKSPRVILNSDSNVFEMQGNSRPENVRDFFYPIIDDLKKYFESLNITEYKEKAIKFNFKLDYFNSSSAKFISDILVIVQTFAKKGFDIKIYWYFDDGDEDMKEVGEDFQEMISYPFNFIMVQR
ncbi:MAG: DUF1987 domain-containing protein [Bacteroidales bacterium]|jgi:hypothetical protein|nr:DUF1987 domain-containing protein [Bacteroidales bacterium]